MNIIKNYFKSPKNNTIEKNGEYIELYDNGKKKSLSYFINNVLNGKSIIYYESGKIKEIIYYTDGLIDKEYIKFHENGNINIICNYKYSLKHGVYKEYDKYNKLIKTIVYNDGNIISEINGINKYYSS